MIVMMLKAIAVITFLGITVGLIRPSAEDAKPVKESISSSDKSYIEEKKGS